MVKIILFLLVLLFVLTYPIYLINRSSFYAYVSKQKGNLSLITLKKGYFFKYDFNLEYEGNFSKLDVYKNFYKTDNILVKNLDKNETFKADNAILKGEFLYMNNFVFFNRDFHFFSSFSIYSLKNKTFNGKNFKIIASLFKGKGSKFFLDRDKNIIANNVIFEYKVNK